MTTPRDATLTPVADELAASDKTRYELTLLVNGASDLSARAIAHAKRLCEVHLPGRYQLSVIDVRDATAFGEELLVTPTLVRNQPLPERRVVGDLSDIDRVFATLRLPLASDAPTARA
jgi:circadian clock protein KaiB